MLLGMGDKPRSNYVKRGAEYISTSLKPSSLLPDPTAQRSLANALQDWDQTVRDNPDMDEAKADAAARRITDHYAEIKSDSTMRANAVPLYLSGSREQPNIAVTAQKTKDAHERGEISDQTFRQQQMLILQWQAATANKTPPKTP
jgi:hypothetical protein